MKICIFALIVSGAAGNAAPATLNGGAAVGPDGKPLTGAGK
ncbi:MAG: hypothetical protein NTX57_16635 [Armatimonadetes bacterium]|nr:hypothetical protein [Armatimonadota bacterium]